MTIAAKPMTDARLLELISNALAHVPGGHRLESAACAIRELIAGMVHDREQLAAAVKDREGAAVLALAIQGFRNLKMLGKLTRLRGKPEYGALCDAWRAWIDAHPHDRFDCPCGHPPGESGVCGGCNCADEAP